MVCSSSHTHSAPLRSIDKISSNCRDLLELQKAAQEGKLDDLEEMLKKLKRPAKNHLLDAKNEYGQTTLFVAAGAGQLKAAKMLLDAGCSSNVADDFERTPLHNAGMLLSHSLLLLP